MTIWTIKLYRFLALMFQIDDDFTILNSFSEGSRDAEAVRQTCRCSRELSSVISMVEVAVALSETC